MPRVANLSRLAKLLQVVRVVVLDADASSHIAFIHVERIMSKLAADCSWRSGSRVCSKGVQAGLRNKHPATRLSSLPAESSGAPPQPDAGVVHLRDLYVTVSEPQRTRESAPSRSAATIPPRAVDRGFASAMRSWERQVAESQPLYSNNSILYDSPPPASVTPRVWTENGWLEQSGSFRADL